jgi:hypothetical protein
MRDLVVILLIALVGTGAALWILRRRPTADGSMGVPGDLQKGGERLDVAAGDGRITPAGERNAGRVATAPPARQAPSEARAPNLAVLEFDSAPWNVTLTRPEVVIGRHSQDDVRIPDVRVSRHHARLVARNDGSFDIHNLTAVRSEPNPMLVNGQECEHASISDGDVVTLGGVSFKIRMAA